VSEKLLFTGNARSNKDLTGSFFALCFFWLIYMIIYFKFHTHSWWLIVFAIFSIGFSVFYKINEIISIYETRRIEVKKLFWRQSMSFETNELYYYVKVGGAKTISPRSIIIRAKNKDKLIFRLPLNSEDEYEKLTNLLSDKLKMKRIKEYGNISGIR